MNVCCGGYLINGIVYEVSVLIKLKAEKQCVNGRTNRR